MTFDLGKKHDDKLTWTFTTLSGEQVVTLDVRRSWRAKRLQLRSNSSSSRIQLVMPRGVTASEAESFVRKNSSWVVKFLSNHEGSVPLAPGQRIAFRGGELLLQRDEARRGAARLKDQKLNEQELNEQELNEQELNEQESNGRESNRGGSNEGKSKPKGDDALILAVPGDEKFFARRVEDWLRREAKELMADYSAEYAKQLGVKFKRIVIRDATTRWGSCSSSGTLSYSWRIVMAPDRVARYLSAHEVSHLREMNHSDAFWSLVRQLHPSYRKDRTWLANEGKSLFKVGR